MGLVLQKHETIGQQIFHKKAMTYLPSRPTYPTFPYKLNFVFRQCTDIKTTLNVKVVMNITDFYLVILLVAILHTNNHAKFDPSPGLIRREKHRVYLQWNPYWQPSR